MNSSPINSIFSGQVDCTLFLLSSSFFLQLDQRINKNQGKPCTKAATSFCPAGFQRSLLLRRDVFTTKTLTPPDPDSPPGLPPKKPPLGGQFSPSPLTRNASAVAATR
jgi:hypothetical protein